MAKLNSGNLRVFGEANRSGFHYPKRTGNGNMSARSP